MRAHTARRRVLSASASAALVLGLAGGLTLTSMGPALAEDTPAPVAPGQPTAVTAVAGDARVTVSWLPSPVVAVPPVTGWTVSAISRGAAYKPVVCDPVTAAAGRLQCVATAFADGAPIVNGTAYTFTVQATNGVQTSPASAPSVAVTPAGKPGAPTIGKVVAGDTSATVSWTAAAANGSPITLYRVYTDTTNRTCSTNGTALKCTVTGLVNGKKYKFRVAALNGKGTGPFSAWSAVVVPVLPPATRLPIKFGQKGPLVTALQQRLGWVGMYVRVNGYFDANTQAMVKRFQGKFFLDRTGVVNASTWTKLVSLTRGNGALPAACRTGTVICVQKTLKLVRYLVNGQPKLVLDARFGADATPTRNGMHSVFMKSRNHVSSLYRSAMPFSLFFDGGQALHYSANFAANGYNGASHGCVNIRDYNGAKRLFEMTSTGTRVYVTS